MHELRCPTTSYSGRDRYRRYEPLAIQLVLWQLVNLRIFQDHQQDKTNISAIVHRKGWWRCQGSQNDRDAYRLDAPVQVIFQVRATALGSNNGRPDCFAMEVHETLDNMSCVLGNTRAQFCVAVHEREIWGGSPVL